MSADTGKPPRPVEPPYGSCDWGGCDAEATSWRFDKDHGWLPVCDKCSRTTWDTTGPGGLPRRKDAMRRAQR